MKPFYCSRFRFIICCPLFLCLLYVYRTNKGSPTRNTLVTPTGAPFDPVDPTSESEICRFARPNPFDSSILKFVTHRRGFNSCAIQPDLAFVDSYGWLRLNSTVADSYSERNLTCTYRIIDIADGISDDKIVTVAEGTLSSNASVALSSDSVAVECFLGATRTVEHRIFYDVFPVSRNLSKPVKATAESQLSVLLLIVDSISRGKFMRNFPKVYKYMTEVMNFKTMIGHHKVGDNTFPNMIPMFTGKRAVGQGPNMDAELTLSKYLPNDDQAFIWKEFSRKDYITSWIEDVPYLGLFHYQLPGFKHRPFDHYYRPYMKLVERDKSQFQPLCFGNSPRVVTQLDILKAETIKYKGLRKFSIFLHADLTHELPNDVERLDVPLYTFFKEMYEGGYFNTTTIMVASDHGARGGPIRSTLVGLLEERLPFLSIFLPKWFHQMNPDISANLDLNVERLTAQFDIHETMLDILNANFGTTQRVNARGLSLLYEIPVHRSCMDAGVPEHYCTCYEIESVGIDDPAVQKASIFAMDRINDMIDQDPEAAGLCIDLKLNKIIRGHLFVNNQKVVQGHIRPRDTGTGVESERKVYHVAFQAQEPSLAEFEAHVEYNSLTNKWSVESDISRINMYGNTSYCVSNVILRKYCYCNNN